MGPCVPPETLHLQLVSLWTFLPTALCACVNMAKSRVSSTWIVSLMPKRSGYWTRHQVIEPGRVIEHSVLSLVVFLFLPGLGRWGRPLRPSSVLMFMVSFLSLFPSAICFSGPHQLHWLACSCLQDASVVGVSVYNTLSQLTSREKKGRNAFLQHLSTQLHQPVPLYKRQLVKLPGFHGTLQRRPSLRQQQREPESFSLRILLTFITRPSDREETWFSWRLCHDSALPQVLPGT